MSLHRRNKYRKLQRITHKDSSELKYRHKKKYC